MARRGALAVGAVAVVVVIAVAAVYLARETIAVSLARQWLAEHGAAASAVELEHLTLTGFSAKVRLGDPNDPDLTVDRMEVRYTLSGPWTGEGFAVHTKSILLVRPHLRARLVGGVVTFGAVDGLIKVIEQLPPSTEPLPDVTLQDGDARLATAGGTVRVHGAGSLRAGALTALQGQLDPVHLTLGADKIDCAGGAFSVESYAGRLKARVDLGPSAYAAVGVAASAARTRLTAEAPYPGGSTSWAGPAQVTADVQGVAGRLGQTVLNGAAVTADFEGAMDAAAARQTARGVLRVSAHAGSLAGLGGAARAVAVQATLSRVSLTHDGAGVSVQSAAQATVTAGAVDTPGAKLTAVSSVMRSRDIAMRSAGAGWIAAGLIDGSLAGRGAVAGGPAGDAPYAAAVRRTLSDFRFAAPNWRAQIASGRADVSLIAPLTVLSTSGGRVTMSGRGYVSALAATGAASLAMAGGGLPALTFDVKNAAVSRGGATADVVARGVVDIPPAKGAHVRMAGRAALNGGQATFVLAGCAPVTVDRVALDPTPVTGLSARICPGAGPLIAAGPSGWRVRGRFDAVQGDMAGAANVRGGAGTFEAAGAAAGLATAALLLEHAQVGDAADPLRFHPLNGAGRIDVARGVATGAINLLTPKQRVLAKIALRHNLASGVGRADIEANDLVFAPGGLQATDLTPLAAVARNADGAVKFTGWFAWRPGAALASGGEASARDFKFSSPLGPVTGLTADIRFTSLLPLVTAPDQTISVNEIQALLPVSTLAARFGLGAETLTLNTATGAMAKGHIRLEPMQIGFGRNAVFKGAVVFDHVNLGEILAATSLSDMVKADAVVDGRIPFEVGPNGVTIQQGHLAAVGPGRISLSRQALNGVSSNAPATAAVGVGLAASGQVNFAQDLAYQAMENLAFDQMDASVNSLAHDRLGMIFHIKGRHDPPTRQKATIALSDLIGGHALDKPFNLPSDTKIDLTLDTSLNFGDLVKALGQAWRDSLSSGGAARRSQPVQGATSKDTSK